MASKACAPEWGRVSANASGGHLSCGASVRERDSKRDLRQELIEHCYSDNEESDGAQNA